MTRCLKTLERELAAPGTGSAGGTPQVFTWKDGNYACTPGRAASSKRNGVGGFTLLADLVLFVRKALLPIPGEGVTEVLKVKDTITFRGETYNVDEIEEDPSRAFLKLTCNHPNRGS